MHTEWFCSLCYAGMYMTKAVCRKCQTPKTEDCAIIKGLHDLRAEADAAHRALQHLNDAWAEQAKSKLLQKTGYRKLLPLRSFFRSRQISTCYPSDFYRLFFR